MKVIFTGTIAAVVLGAAIASSQTPEPAQPTAPVAAEQAQPAAQPAADAPRQPAADRPQAARSQSSTTYRGILKGSATSGWTIAPIGARSAAATSTPGATATAGASTSSTTTYNVISTDPKVDLTTMADQCVEIAGSLLPESASSSAASSPAAGAARSAAASNRTLTVTTIRAMQGGCTQ